MSEMIFEFFCLWRGGNRMPGILKHCTEKSKLRHLCFQEISSHFHSPLKSVYYLMC